jgi:stage II sporulation protein E
LDIAAVDLNSGEAEFVKIGAPVSFIIRGKECIVLEGEGLPLGILESVKPTVCHEQLQSGDMLVFMSDGVTEAFHSTPDLCEYIGTLSPLNPQALADNLLSEALHRTHPTSNSAPEALQNSTPSPEDDMTILCVRLFTPTD